jgi:hypothetical protein
VSAVGSRQSHTQFPAVPWVRWQNNYYQFNACPKDWFGARADCRRQGGDLAWITAQSETEWIAFQMCGLLTAAYQADDMFAVTICGAHRTSRPGSAPFSTHARLTDDRPGSGRAIRFVHRLLLLIHITHCRRQSIIRTSVFHKMSASVRFPSVLSFTMRFVGTTKCVIR